MNNFNELCKTIQMLEYCGDVYSLSNAYDIKALHNINEQTTIRFLNGKIHIATDLISSDGEKFRIYSKTRDSICTSKWGKKIFRNQT